MSLSASDLSPAETFILAEIAEDEAPLWELSYLCYETYDRSGHRTVGPGALIADADEVLRLAQRAAISLVEKNLATVHRGPDWYGDGDELERGYAIEELEDPRNWLWPLDHPRDEFVWLVPTATGIRVVESIAFENFPTVRHLRWDSAVSRRCLASCARESDV